MSSVGASDVMLAKCCRLNAALNLTDLRDAVVVGNVLQVEVRDRKAQAPEGVLVEVAVPRGELFAQRSHSKNSCEPQEVGQVGARPGPREDGQLRMRSQYRHQPLEAS